MVSEPIYRVYRFGEERKKRKVIRSRIERNQSEEKKRSNSIYNPNPSKAKRKGTARLPGHHRRLERRLPPCGEPQWRRLTGASPPSCGKGTRAAAVLLHRACGLRAKGTAPRPLDGGALPLRRARVPPRGPVAPPPSPPVAMSGHCSGKEEGREKRKGARGHRRWHGGRTGQRSGGAGRSPPASRIGRRRSGPRKKKEKSRMAARVTEVRIARRVLFPRG